MVSNCYTEISVCYVECVNKFKYRLHHIYTDLCDTNKLHSGCVLKYESFHINFKLLKNISYQLLWLVQCHH